MIVLGLFSCVQTTSNNFLIYKQRITKQLYIELCFLLDYCEDIVRRQLSSQFPFPHHRAFVSTTHGKFLVKSYPQLHAVPGHIHSLTSPELSCLARVQLTHTSLLGLREQSHQGGWMVPLKREKGMWKKPDVSRQKHTNIIVGKTALNIRKDLSTQQKHTSMFKFLTGVSTFAFCAYSTCCYRAPAHNWAFCH